MDSDGDGIFDTVEATIGTNPNNFDTDGDGLNDGDEVDNGTNPLQKEPTTSPTKVRITLFYFWTINLHEHGYNYPI